MGVLYKRPVTNGKLFLMKTLPIGQGILRFVRQRLDCTKFPWGKFSFTYTTITPRILHIILN